MWEDENTGLEEIGIAVIWDRGEVHGEWRNLGSHMHSKHRLSCFENKMCCFTLLPLDYPYLSDTTYDLSTLSEGVEILNLETDAVTQC